MALVSILRKLATTVLHFTHLVHVCKREHARISSLHFYLEKCDSSNLDSQVTPSVSHSAYFVFSELCSQLLE